MKFGEVHARKKELQLMGERVTTWSSPVAGFASKCPHHEADVFRREGLMP